MKYHKTKISTISTVVGENKKMPETNLVSHIKTNVETSPICIHSLNIYFILNFIAFFHGLSGFTS